MVAVFVVSFVEEEAEEVCGTVELIFKLKIVLQIFFFFLKKSTSNRKMSMYLYIIFLFSNFLGLCLCQSRLIIDGKTFPGTVSPGCVFLPGCPCYQKMSGSYTFLYCRDGTCDKSTLYCGTPDPRATSGGATTPTAASTPRPANATPRPTTNAPPSTTTTTTTTATTVRPTTTGGGTGAPDLYTAPANCSLYLDCACLLDRCSSGLRCIDGQCVVDPAAPIESVVDFDRISIESDMFDCGCSQVGSRNKIVWIESFGFFVLLSFQIFIIITFLKFDLVFVFAFFFFFLQDCSNQRCDRKRCSRQL